MPYNRTHHRGNKEETTNNKPLLHICKIMKLNHSSKLTHKLFQVTYQYYTHISKLTIEQVFPHGEESKVEAHIS